MAEVEKVDWMGPWSGLIHCPNCHALMSGDSCPVCNHALPTKDYFLIEVAGQPVKVASQTYQGALSWTAHSLLGLMRREWEKPAFAEEFTVAPIGHQCSQRVLIVILFWTLFEHLMEQLLQSAMVTLPAGVASDLLKRYQSIGSRIDRLYSLLFNAKLADDLNKLGFNHVLPLLMEIQSRRNDFVHGNAEAINDELVDKVVANLNGFQGAWVALFNLRCTGNPGARPVWEDQKHRDLLGSIKLK